MRRILLLLLLLVGLAGFCPSVMATKADSAVVTTKEQTLYIFGVSQNLSDSVAYVTDVVPITGTNLLKNGMFTDRDLYAEQLRDFVERTFSSRYQTAVVFYGKKLEALDKKRQKLRTKLAGKPVGLSKVVVKDLYKDQFVFKKLEVPAGQ